VATIGILAEHKAGEARVPLTPQQMAKLQHTHPNISFEVQKSAQRAFTSEEFSDRGIPIVAQVSAPFRLAVKEIPLEQVHPGIVYLFFSHTIKGQPYNMPLLQRFLDQGATLLDYELIRDRNGRRLVFFGRFAGLAGMVNTLRGYGLRLRAEGEESPFTMLRQAKDYYDLAELEKDLEKLAKALPDYLKNRSPLVIGIAGYGNVSKGVQEILSYLPVRELTPEELLSWKPESVPELIKVVFKEEHMVEPRDPGKPFVLQDYYAHPENYRAVFERYLDKLTILMNCIYWEERYPRLLTKEWVKKNFLGGSHALKIVGDISCDIQGAIECNLGISTSAEPYYVFDPLEERRVNGVVGQGPVLMAVDNLPTELPRESSHEFGEALMPFLPTLVGCDFNRTYEELDLHPALKQAVIVLRGELTPPFEYLKEFLKNIKPQE